MFKNYKSYYENFTKYLTTLDAQVNTNDMESGFAVVETFIMHVYGNYLNHKYRGKYSEVKEEMIFIDSSIDSDRIETELKLESLSDYIYKEFSYLDTLKNIGNYLFFNGTAYIFTDYGLIEMYGRSGESSKIAKIISINIWVYKKEYKDELQGFINSCLVEIPSTQNQKILPYVLVVTMALRNQRLK